MKPIHGVIVIVAFALLFGVAIVFTLALSSGPRPIDLPNQANPPAEQFGSTIQLGASR